MGFGPPWVWVWMAATAWGGELHVAVEDGALHAGRASVVEWATGDADAPSDMSLEVDGAVHQRLAARGAIGRMMLRPASDVTEVVVSVRDGERSYTARLPVVSEPAPTLLVRDVAAYVGSETVTLRITGDVDPRHLQVVLSEGRVRSVEARPDGVDVVVEPASDPYPRVVPFGVRDLRSGDTPPAWAAIRLRGRPVVPIRTARGTRVTLVLGRRTYGPVVVPSSGEVALPVVQEPGDRVARLTLEEPNGSITRRSFPLTSGRAAPVLPFVDGAWRAGTPAPSVWLRMPEGEEDAGVVCQGPSIPPSQAVRAGPGVRRVVLPLQPPAEAWEIRMRCETTRGGEVTFSVPAAEGVPSGLRVRMWPEVLSADLPVADLAVTLENALGERVEPRGRVDITARHGEVVPVQRAGAGLRAEYRGHVVSEVGEDVLTVAWFAPPGEEPVAGLMLASAGEDEDGAATVHVRALDALRRPVGGVRVGLGPVGAEPEREGITGADGWATLAVPEQDTSVHRVALWVDGRRRSHALIIPEVVDPGGPGTPDLLAEVPVQVDPGRVAEVALDVGDGMARPGQRAGVSVLARFLDRNGLPARDPRPTLEAEEGTVGPAEVLSDGTVAWTWRPGPGLRPRDVRLVARSEALDLEDEVRVRVAPREIRRFVGLGFGVHSNFGRVTSPRAKLELGWMLPLGGGRGAGRGEPGLEIGGAVGWYGVSSAVDVLGEDDGLLRMNIIPVTLQLAYRHTWPLHAVWFGGGLVLAPWTGSSRVGGVLTARDAGLFTPGVAGRLGYGTRVPGGELGFEVGVSSLTSPGGPASLRGWVGGVAAGLTYRIAY